MCPTYFAGDTKTIWPFIYLILTTQNIKSRCEQNLKSNDANWTLVS
jgi:hypothetical protein